MRHLYGTALATVMALAMFFGGAWGYLQLLKLPVPPGNPGALPAAGGSLLSSNSVLFAMAVVAAVGVLAGVLVAVPRISPLASGLPGLLLIGWTVLFLVSVRSATAMIPLRSHSFGAGWEALLFNGVLGAAGLVMIVPMFIPSRWRGDSRSRRPDRQSGEAARSGEDRGKAGRARDIWEPAGASAGKGARTRSAGSSRTGLIGAATGPTGPATGRPATGPIDTRSDPRTGPIRTTSPIRTTGPIRLKPPEDR